MNKKTIFLMIVVLASVIFISGCAEQSSIKSTEEVGRAVTNVSTDIQDVTSTLDDIDRTLGGG